VVVTAGIAVAVYIPSAAEVDIAVAEEPDTACHHPSWLVEHVPVEPKLRHSSSVLFHGIRILSLVA
jgi:hypothetical protein